MNYEKIHINEMRYKGLIKGNRPFICSLAKSTTSYFRKSRKYIISYRDNLIYFQSLSFFSEVPNQKNDYEINITNIANYNYLPINKNLVSFSLKLKKRGFINFLIYKNLKKRIYSQIVFEDFLTFIRSKGIKDEEEINR